MGRKKIVIRRIENKAARDICFSKRRQGLFRKANELAVMCGAQVAAVVYSRAGKAYSFGHPSAEDIVDRFLRPAEQAGAAGAGMGAAVDPDRLAEQLQQKYNELCTEQNAVEQRKELWGEAIAKGRAEGSQAAAWLDAVADQRDMRDADMLACMASLREAQVTVAAGVNQVLQDGRRDREAALAPLPPQLLAGGGGFELGGTGQMMAVMPTPGFAVGGGFELGGTSADGWMEELMTAIAGFGGLELGGTSLNGGTDQMVTVMPTPGFVGGVGCEPDPWFELGGTSASGGMEDVMRRWV
ncbi:agamous-like MADS-box protein AGL61 [Triticum aestivum]|uniref:agamous-like MADS-box protein AGL61 n=1 Tax=Triticum aestivum TaxID=4565 RepID=UPI001D02717E|nr:agamous-like MADS-box protein AGL61 [Triticum aestivum]